MPSAKKSIKINVSDAENEGSGTSSAKKTAVRKTAAKKKTPAKKTAVRKTAVKKANAGQREKIPAAKPQTAVLKKSQIDKIAVSDGDAASDKGNPKAGKNEATIVNKEIKETEAFNRQSGPVPAEATVQKYGFDDKEDKRRGKNDSLLPSQSDPVKDLVASTMVAEEERKNEQSAQKNEARQRSVTLYRKIAYGFIFFTLVLLVAIFYFAFVKATVILVPNQERISNSMIIDITDVGQEVPASDSSIKGQVKTVAIEHSKMYPASGNEIIGEETVGTVTIINNYTKNQPLVATTRLMSPDNKLFRLKDTVNVPAGGSVAVDVYADKAGEDTAIGPTKFIIPGLWAGLQDKIYAESDSAMSYQKKLKKEVSSEDIDNGVRDLKQSLLNKAKETINKDYNNYSQIIYKIDENSIASEVMAEAGDEIDEFEIKMTADIMVIAFNDQQTAELARQKFLNSLSDSKELIEFEGDNIIYALDNYDSSENKASVNATFEGKVSLKESAEIVEIEKILGLNQAQLETYLKGLPEIAGYEIKFFPSFIKKVPKLADRVEIIIKK